MSKNATKQKGICVVGSANIDLTFRTPRLPVPGETLAGRSLHQCMGGKVDTTGAGDAFTGALAVGLAEGLMLEEAARRAGVVAALSVTRTGTQPSFPTLKEVNQWIAT